MKIYDRKTGGKLNAWTLAEMLAVLAALSVLVAVSIPAIRGMHQTSSRSSAVGDVMAFIDQARSLALAHGKPSYLVIANQPPADQGAFQRLGLYLEADDPSLPPVPVSRWITLPSLYRMQDNATTPSLFTARAEISPPSFLLPGETEERALPYLKFNPTGGVAHPKQSEYACLILTPTQGASDLITVAPFTGRPKCHPVP